VCTYLLRDEGQAEAGIAATKKELNSGVCISSIALAELEYKMKHSSNPIKMSRRFFTS